MKDRNFLIEMYNATTEEFPKGSDEIETYEHWLEKQLLSKINSTPPETKTSEEIDKLAKERFPNKFNNDILLIQASRHIYKEGILKGIELNQLKQ